MQTNQIRQTYLDFFTAREHLRVPSAPLVPATYDPSVLLTTAGMHPLKAYFLGEEQPPARRLTSCQKCFRTTDIEQIGNTARHLTFFEMLGNFSIGDYFKADAIKFAWELSTQGFQFDADQIWVTVFGGDEQLGVGPDEEAIEAWLEVGVQRERIVALGRADNFWQAGPTGPCGPCSELYLDRGPDFGGPNDRPGDDTERFLEYWNLVFMQYNQYPAGTLEPLPAKSIDTGLGLNRLAAIKQDVESVFDTDQFKPLVELAEELSLRQYRESEQTTRAMRILADHTRALTFLLADGIVPSNEERGYILRRVMRRAIQQGGSIGLKEGFLPRFAERVIELMGAEYPELVEQRAAILEWTSREESSFGRTLEHGTHLLEELITRVRADGGQTIAAADAFRLHDTYGFPIDLTAELLAEAGLTVDRAEFGRLMNEQRQRARAQTGGPGTHAATDAVREFATSAGFTTQFTGYETTAQQTTIGALQPAGEHLLVKLAKSPFYSEGGGQVSDVGVLECAADGCQAEVVDVVRVGDDQALAVNVLAGELAVGTPVVARIDPVKRHATEANHTATHLLHAALRQQLGEHVRQAGSAVRPDKLRFDFNHTQALTATELQAVEDQVNEWIAANTPVQAQTLSFDEAKGRGAMALFGEKYGSEVRMVEVGDGSFSRELCGGTHVRRTAEIGLFRIINETASAANVRRIEAVTGPAAAQLLRAQADILRTAASRLHGQPETVLAKLDEQAARIVALETQLAQFERAKVSAVADELLQTATEQAGVKVLIEAASGAGDLMELVDRLKNKLSGAVIVLGAKQGDKVQFVVSVAPELVQLGLNAGTIVRAAAEVAGGGGGGRPTLARAGGKDPAQLIAALAAARQVVESELTD